jgi:Flp pilus assembly protein CpaB
MARTHEEQARRKAEGAYDYLRQAQVEAQARVDEFAEFADSWKRALDDGDPLRLAQTHVAIQAEEHVEALTHLHSGSSHASTVRMLKRRLFELAALENGADL